MNADPYNLNRFLAAQERVYAGVLDELRAGRKRSHWMWFIFPQLRGLGYSEMAQFYGIGSMDEARAYLAHATLGRRLAECTRLAAESGARAAHDVFGSPDDDKFRSCMTLFEAASGERARDFSAALRELCGDERDPETLRRLAAPAGRQ